MKQFSLSLTKGSAHLGKRDFDFFFSSSFSCFPAMSDKNEAARSVSLTITRGQLKNFQLEQSATEILVWINTCIDSPIAFNDDQATTASDQLMEALKSGVILSKV